MLPDRPMERRSQTWGRSDVERPRIRDWHRIDWYSVVYKRPTWPRNRFDPFPSRDGFSTVDFQSKRCNQFCPRYRSVTS